VPPSISICTFTPGYILNLDSFLHHERLVEPPIKKTGQPELSDFSAEQT
jgi:hypothetical protein